MRKTFLAIFLIASRLAFAQSPAIGHCPVFTAANIWNARVDALPVAPPSRAWVESIGSSAPLHPDFGSGLWHGAPNGIPYVLVDNTQDRLPAKFEYRDESDAGPYAIPLNTPIEGGAAGTGDRHAIAIDTDRCVLYELYSAHPILTPPGWKAGSGAIFNLLSDRLRPAEWTSADAAGLPIFPGLVRYDEIQSGAIRHALRFTAPRTRSASVWPARHHASKLTEAKYPPMGARFRLAAAFDISRFSPTNQIILTALKQYGMMLADNGSAWYISGAPDARWQNDDLHLLETLKGADFEAVDVTPLQADPNSGAVRLR